MLNKMKLLGIVLTSAIAFIIATAQAKAQQAATQCQPCPSEQWVLSLGGSGGTTTTGDSQSAFGADISIGRTGHLLLPLEGGLRQSFDYVSMNGGSTLLSSKVYLDATLISYKRLDLFAGGNIGMTYGNVPMFWEAAPEAGVRFWLKRDVAVIGRVEYPFDLTNGKSENNLKYFVGLQVKL